jgi:hypothetical protein
MKVTITKAGYVYINGRKISTQKATPLSVNSIVSNLPHADATKIRSKVCKLWVMCNP